VLADKISDYRWQQQHHHVVKSSGRVSGTLLVASSAQVTSVAAKVYGWKHMQAAA